MKDQEKTKLELLDELRELRRRITGLESAQAKSDEADHQQLFNALSLKMHLCASAESTRTVL